MTEWRRQPRVPCQRWCTCRRRATPSSCRPSRPTSAPRRRRTGASSRPGSCVQVGGVRSTLAGFDNWRRYVTRSETGYVPLDAVWNLLRRIAEEVVGLPARVICRRARRAVRSVESNERRKTHPCIGPTPPWMKKIQFTAQTCAVRYTRKLT